MKSIFDSGNLPEAVAFFSDSSSSARSCSSDFLLALDGAEEKAGIAEARGANGAGAGAATGSGITAGSGAGVGFAIVIPSRTKSSAPLDADVGGTVVMCSATAVLSENIDLAATAAAAAVAAVAATAPIAGAMTDESAAAPLEAVGGAMPPAVAWPGKCAKAISANFCLYSPLRSIASTSAEIRSNSSRLP